MPELHKLATHVTYAVEMGHSQSEGLTVCPVAGPAPQKASILRLHAPIETLSVSWIATREGAPPIVPSHKAFATNFNRVFLGGQRGADESPTFGGHIWSASGVYVYALLTAEGLDSDLPVAKVPWDDSSGIGEFFIPAANFDASNIINPKQVIPRGSS